MHHPLQYLIIGLMCLNLVLSAALDGKPRDPHSLTGAIANTLVGLALYWACGLFSL